MNDEPLLTKGQFADIAHFAMMDKEQRLLWVQQ